MGSRNISMTLEKSSSSPAKCSGCFLPGGTDQRLPSPHQIFFSVCLSVCLFHIKTCRIFTQELKSGCPLGVFCPQSIPSKYLFLCTRRKFVFNKKIHRKLLIVYVYFQPNSCNTHTDCEWAQGTFPRQRRKVPPAHAQRVCGLGGTILNFSFSATRSIYPHFY